MSNRIYWLILVSLVGQFACEVKVVAPSQRTFGEIQALKAILMKMNQLNPKNIVVALYALKMQNFEEIVNYIARTSTSPIIFYMNPRAEVIKGFQQQVVLVLAQKMQFLMKTSKHLTHYKRESIAYCLIFVLTSDEKSFERNTKKFDLNQMRFNFYFLVNAGKFFALQTFLYFKKQSCRRPALETINRYSKNLDKWSAESFYVDKFADLYGCEITFDVYEDMPSVYYEDNGDIAGYNFMLMTIISKRFNFRAMAHKLEIPKDRVAMTDPTKDFSLQMMATARYLEQDYAFRVTQPYFFSNIGFVIPPGNSKF